MLGTAVGISVVTVITFLIRLPLASVMYKLPALSKRAAAGPLIVAEVAADPSPVDEAVPVPAMVVITPVEASTLRTRLLSTSHMYTLSALSSTTPWGEVK